jgi:FkbM family methyltransferase
MSIRKLVRTLQNFGPLGRDVTETIQQSLMRVTRRPHERDFHALRFCPADALILDVGANHGQSILSISLVAPDAAVAAFEPNRRLAARIAARWAREPRVTVHAVGLSDVPGSLPLYVPSYRGHAYDGLASFDRREAVEWLTAEAIYGFRPEHVTLAEIPCELRPLDSFVFAKNPYLMKIDAQGHEYKVLVGARRTIEAARPLLLIEGSWREPAIASCLRACGYSRYEFDGQHTFVRIDDAAPSGALNSFFVTEDRRAELIGRGALLR